MLDFEEYFLSLIGLGEVFNAEISSFIVCGSLDFFFTGDFSIGEGNGL